MLYFILAASSPSRIYIHSESTVLLIITNTSTLHKQSVHFPENVVPREFSLEMIG